MKQRRSIPLIFAMIGFLLLCGAWKGSAESVRKPQDSVQPSRLLLILVDMSGSADQARHTVCQEAFQKIYKNLRHGDRVIVGTIASQSYIDFKPAVDEEIPVKTVWDNRLQYERSLTRAKEKIRSEVEKLLSQSGGSLLTEILDSLNIADAIFHDEKERQKILIILSDMIQDSKDYKFDKDKITEDYIGKIIRYREEKKLIPNLTGVKVYVAGASASDSNTFRAVQTFWTRYFVKTGADFSLYRYGHSLINFENGSK